MRKGRDVTPSLYCGRLPLSLSVFLEAEVRLEIEKGVREMRIGFGALSLLQEKGVLPNTDPTSAAAFPPPPPPPPSNPHHHLHHLLGIARNDWREPVPSFSWPVLSRAYSFVSSLTRDTDTSIGFFGFPDYESVTSLLWGKVASVIVFLEAQVRLEIERRVWEMRISFGALSLLQEKEIEGEASVPSISSPVLSRANSFVSSLTSDTDPKHPSASSAFQIVNVSQDSSGGRPPLSASSLKRKCGSKSKDGSGRCASVSGRCRCSKQRKSRVKRVVRVLQLA
ncbi:hypothetical protein AAC387_Pa05g1229 [Persea americana]